MKPNFQHSSPIYLQLSDRIQRQILRGELKPGEKLPSVREMAMFSQVNPNTVQRTYNELERMGIVETRRGQGTFITEDAARLNALRDDLRQRQIATFVEAMEEMGFHSQEILTGLETYLNKHKGSDQD
ncbi:MAG: GntR family transcriptional regulator [Firmicutes bacterium]|uniref:DNA-binding transcriptional regulator YhcF, GntR family n=1 Tax=Melghirimyces thermohalophilus TaxID=1236220 RepID=A0A1G6QGH0_9BACL|nr:GntR family transcriptional regulator [Melghirimyces thermohalophilus]MDA8352053.1 GntR family transcriptional regulator [Bacillota bacterium]SDC91499.1 DNA-binding transcriptional regulator YhcF, GntR family [Melghirimyces thermohalophilus]